jgi:hypothetical protein
VTTAQGKPYPMRCGSDEERQTWLARLSQALESETTMPNMSISGPSTSQSLPAKPTGGAGGAASPPSRRPSAFLGEIGGTRRPGGMGPSGAGGAGAAGGGKRGSIKPMHLNTSVQVTDFDLLKVVGKGAFGKVFLVKKREGANSDQLYAMKVLDKEVIAEKQQVAHTKSERDILHEIQHPFIVMMHYAFQTERKLYMVTDYYPGGNLFAHVQRSRRTGGFDEEVGANLRRKLYCGFTHSTHSYSSLVSSLLIVGLSLALYSWFFYSLRPTACAVLRGRAVPSARLFAPGE